MCSYCNNMQREHKQALPHMWEMCSKLRSSLQVVEHLCGQEELPLFPSLDGLCGSDDHIELGTHCVSLGDVLSGQGCDTRSK